MQKLSLSFTLSSKENALVLRPVEPSDHELIDLLCVELKRGDISSFSLFYNRFHVLFSSFTQKRVHTGITAEDVLGDFWFKLLNPRVFCSYSSAFGVTPKAYLLAVLKNHITDANRKATRDPLHLPSDLTEDAYPGEKWSVAEAPVGGHIERVPDPDDPETLVREALSLLCQIHPADALLLQLRMAGHPYKDILSRKMLGAQAPSQGSLCQKENALKTRHIRAKKRLGVILKRLCDKKGVQPEDLLR